MGCWCRTRARWSWGMDVVYRTARVAVRVTPGRERRSFGLLVAAGDVWAALIAVNEARFRRGARPIANYQEWCREIAGVRVGELSVAAMRSVVRRYCDGFFATAARKRAGEPARYPRRRRRLFPVRWYHDTFTLDGRRLRLSTARGTPELWVRLAREVPYPAEQIRSVTLLVDAGRLVVDVTAAASTKPTTKPPRPSSTGRSSTVSGPSSSATPRASPKTAKVRSRTGGSTRGGAPTSPTR